MFKPADLVPGSAWALAEILSRAGLPAGTFNLVMGRGRDIGDTLLNDPRIAAVTFTGSEATGRKVAQALPSVDGRPGFNLQPTLFTQTSNAMRINREEIFGPVASVIRVEDADEALAMANDPAFGLSAGVCTTSLKHAAHFKRHLQAGMVMVNAKPQVGNYPTPIGRAKSLEWLQYSTIAHGNHSPSACDDGSAGCQARLHHAAG